MVDIKKTSIRQEAERIKVEFERLAAQKKINSECFALMKLMFMLIELMIAMFLEKSLKKTSKNSSIPPSQTQKDNSSLTQEGSNGKGKLERLATANNTRTIETVTISYVETCDICGKNLKNVRCQHYEERTTIDIVFEKVVQKVEAEIKICPECKSTVKGAFPIDMPGPLQYGPGLKAYVINLLVCQMISLNRAQKLIKALIGETISEATFLKFILRFHEALAQWELKATKQILLCSAMNVDETSLRVDMKNHWIHVYSADDITLKFLHPSRGTEAINQIDIIPRYDGVIIHDCWSSYLTYENCEHALCGSHLVRELTGIIDANQYKWAAQMKALLLDTCQAVSKLKKKKISEKKYAKLQKNYRRILTCGEKELPAIPPKPDGKRGKIAKSDAHNLWERLQKYEIPILLFAQRADVSFTNNRAERDLRMAKVKQKVSGCFRKELYAQAYCRISSYLQTMATKGHNPLIAIQKIFDGKLIDLGRK